MHSLRGVVAFLVVSAAASVARAEFETPLAITGAKIVPTVGKAIDAGVIVIERGRIVAVGADVSVPAHAETLDAGGMIVYPGFIDANATTGMVRRDASDEERARVEDENPDVRDGPQSATVQAYRRLMHPRWRAEELFDPQAARMENARKSGFTAALVSPHVAIFAGRSAVIQLGDRPLRRSILRTGVAQHAAFVTSAGVAAGRGGRRGGGGADFAMPGYPTTTMGAMAAFRQIMLDARWQADLEAWAKRGAGRERPPLDEDLAALLESTEGTVPVAFFANRENEIHRALDMAAEFKLKPIIVGGREAWRAAERLKRDDVPVLLSLKWSDEPKDRKERKGRRGRGRNASSPATESAPDTQPTTSTSKPAPELEPTFDDEWENQAWEPLRESEEKKRLWGEEVDNARRLADAGVRFAFASLEMESAEDVLKNIRKAIERGLTEDAALSALTARAADLLGVADQIGELAPGRLANLTVMTKPLADEKGKVRWVFVEGRRIDVSRADDDGDDDEKGRDDRGAKDRQKRAATQSIGGSESQPADAAESRPQSAPASESASTGASRPADAPTFRIETEADRRPRLQTGGVVLLRNATLLTITSGDQPETDLLIRDGKIAQIGRGLTPPSGATVIDLRGYYVSPGIFDTHSHMCSDGGLNEFALSVTCEVRVKDVIDHRDVSAYRALAGGVTMIHTMHGSANTIGGQCAVVRLKWGRPAAEWHFDAAPRTVKFALGENVKQSSFQRRGTRFPNSRMGVEAVMRRSFDAARQYQTEKARFERERAAGRDPRPVRRDLRLDALVDIMDGGIWVNCHCYRADEMLRLFEVAEDYGFRVATLHHVLEGYRVVPEMFRHGVSGSTFSDWWGYKLEAYDATPFNAARMVQGGVLTTVNSDSAELVRHLNLEAAKSLRFGGLSPNDALRTVTLNAAMQFGVEARVGSLEVGKLGDLAVFDGHPLDTFSRCVMTLIDGEVFFQHEAFEPTQPAAPRAASRFAPARRPIAIPPGAASYAIRGATLHPVSGPPIPDGVLVIGNGKIAAIGAAGRVTIPPDARMIDAAGLQVYPGLINAGTTLGLNEIGSVPGGFDENDIGQFQPDLMALSAYNPFSAAVEVARAEGVTSVLVAARGGPIAGRAGLTRLAGWSMPEAAVERSVGLMVDLPSLPPSLDRLDEDARRNVRKDVAEQLAGLESFLRLAKRYGDVSRLAAARPEFAPELDRRLEAMQPFLAGARPVLLAADSYKEIREAIKFAERYRLRPIIFGGREAWKAADELAAKKIDVIVMRSMNLPAGDFEPWDSVYHNAAALAQAGVRFCFATGGATLVKLLGVEAGMAVAHGLYEERSLRAITLDAAAILGVAERLGSLEAGKDADVIITTASPLQASNTVVASFIAGRPVELASKHSRLDEQWRARPKPALPPGKTLRGPKPLRLR